MKKAIFIFVLLTVFSGCRDVIFDNPFDPNVSRVEVKIIKIIDTTLSGNGGLCFDGEKIWLASENGIIYALDIDSGVILREIHVGGTPTGITFFKGLLYISLGQEGTILLVDPLSGDILNEIPLGDRLPYLLTNDGVLLILYDAKSQSIYSFDEQTGNLGFMFKITGFQPSGLEIWNGNLVLVERKNLSIYVFSTAGDILKNYSSPTNYPGGITRDNQNNFYLFSTDGKIYKISLF